MAEKHRLKLPSRWFEKTVAKVAKPLVEKAPAKYQSDD